MRYRRHSRPRSNLERLAMARAHGRDRNDRALAELGVLAGLPAESRNAAQPFGYEQRSRFVGTIIPCLAPATEVASLLPVGLELAPHPLGPPNLHPVLFMFGRHASSGWWGEH